MPKINLDFFLVNWNIGGAKFLELPSKSKPKEEQQPTKGAPQCQNDFRSRLQDALKALIDIIGDKPHVITMQEVVQFEKSGNSQNPEDLFSKKFIEDLGYKYHFFPLIDTLKHSAQAKWNKLIKEKDRGWNEKTYFAQGNAILVRNDIALFPVWSIPKLETSLEKYNEEKNSLSKETDDSTPSNNIGSACDDFEKNKLENKSIIECSSEVVFVEQGLYFGDRNTEPRAAIVTHIVLDGSLTMEKTGSQKKLKKPLDLFVINLHLTTLSNEREGIPSKDEEACIRRLKQLDIVFNDIISRYNSWKQVKEYRLREKEYPVTPEVETTDRHKPVWVVAGDFNFTPESEEYDYIIKRNFFDLIPDHEVGTKASGLAKEPTLTLDYVFAGPLYYSIIPDDARIRIRQNRVETGKFAMVSDHMPIIVKVPIHIEEEDEEVYRRMKIEKWENEGLFRDKTIKKWENEKIYRDEKIKKWNKKPLGLEEVDELKKENMALKKKVDELKLVKSSKQSGNRAEKAGRS